MRLDGNFHRYSVRPLHMSRDRSEVTKCIGVLVSQLIKYEIRAFKAGVCVSVTKHKHTSNMRFEIFFQVRNTPQSHVNV